jgi:hypothetical protein
MELPYSIILRFIYGKEIFWHTFIKDHPKFLKMTFLFIYRRINNNYPFGDSIEGKMGLMDYYENSNLNK